MRSSSVHAIFGILALSLVECNADDPSDEVTSESSIVSGGAGLRAEYFANTTLTGPAVTRSEKNVNFDWDLDGPAGVPVDNFSARWTGRLTVPATGDYELGTVSDDGVRLFVDEATIVQRWTAHAATRDTATVRLEAGEHSIRMEYYEQMGRAVAQLIWKPVGATAFVPIPSTSLSHEAEAAQGPEDGFYVAPDGNDRNAGTKSMPWRTLQHAADALSPGETVWIRGGEYTSRNTDIVTITKSGRAGAYISYKAYPGEKPLLTVPLNTNWNAIKSTRSRPTWRAAPGLSS